MHFLSGHCSSPLCCGISGITRFLLSTSSYPLWRLPTCPGSTWPSCPQVTLLSYLSVNSPVTPLSLVYSFNALFSMVNSLNFCLPLANSLYTLLQFISAWESQGRLHVSVGSQSCGQAAAIQRALTHVLMARGGPGNNSPLTGVFMLISLHWSVLQYRKSRPVP